MSEYAIHCQKSQRTLQWRDGDFPILDFAEQAGIAAPYSCRMGQCHGCAVDLLEGQVLHPPDVVLPSAKQVLTCCAIPRSDVVLNL